MRFDVISLPLLVYPLDPAFLHHAADPVIHGSLGPINTHFAIKRQLGVLSHHINHWAFTVASYSIATAVGLQRIDETAHWPSDVFFGAVWGTAIARTIVRLHERRKTQVSPSLSSKDGTLRLDMIYRF